MAGSQYVQPVAKTPMISLRHRLSILFGVFLLCGGLVSFAAPALADDQNAQSPVLMRQVDGPLVAQALDIEDLLEDGDDQAAILAARDFLRMVTDRTGFGVTGARLTVSPATGYGVYTPRPSNVYEPGEPVFAYIEIYGFSLTQQTGEQDGLHQDVLNTLNFDVSFTLDTPEGEQMTDALIPMGEVVISSYREPIDGYLQLTYRITGAQGEYVLRTEVVDRASGEIAEFTLPVVFAHPDAALDDK